jgi:hypothetical protein
MLYDLDIVLSKLDVLLRTLIPTGFLLAEANPWISKILQNPREADSQTSLIKTRISNY